MLRIRPQVLAVFIAGLLGARKNRHVVTTTDNIKLSIDPLADYGPALVRDGEYESHTAAIFRRCLKPGNVVLDVGANEGYFTTLAANLVGPRGRVIAVEPQNRICEILATNIGLNNFANVTIVNAALSDHDGGAQIFLTPSFNTGASSLVRRYRWSRRRQAIRTISATTLLNETKCDRFDFVKVDVEGYEPEVIRGLIPPMNEGRVSRLLLDYHASILDQRGISMNALHDGILATGMAVEQQTDPNGGYVLYRRNSSRGA